MRTSQVLAAASLLFAVLFYGLSVGGILWGKPTPPTDVGVISVAGIFAAFGVAGLLLKPATPLP